MPALLEPPKVEQPAEWYKPGKSIRQFHEDSSFVRILCGGRGSGKTYALAADITRHLWFNAGGKSIVARKTETSQAGSTIDTFLQYFEDMGDLYSWEGGGLFKSWNDGLAFRVPSLKAVEAYNQFRSDRTRSAREIAIWVENEGSKLCGHIEMKGLPHVSAGESKLRGMECSYLALVEADQIERRYFNLCLACLRWKGADPETCDELGFIIDKSVVLDTNPPGTKHWIALMEAEEQAKPPEEQRMRFWHIPTKENEANLPENYIRDQIELPYANNPAMLDRMRDGRYADAYEGSPVFYAYSRTNHEGEDLPWHKGAYLVRSYDQGNPNATVFAQYWIEDNTEYWQDLYEIVLQDSDADRQSKQAIFSTNDEFPFWNNRDICAGVLDFCDPAYNSRSGTERIEVNKDMVDASQLNVFRKNGIYPGMRTSARGLQETLGIINRLLQKRDSKGRYCYRIDVKGCPNLANAMRGGYRYPSVGEPGYGKNEPLKGPICLGLDGVADASRYGKINILRLLQAEMDAMKKPNFAKARKNPNPTRAI